MIAFLKSGDFITNTTMQGKNQFPQRGTIASLLYPWNLFATKRHLEERMSLRAMYKGSSENILHFIHGRTEMKHSRRATPNENWILSELDKK